jgi:hypothetical protein
VIADAGVGGLAAEPSDQRQLARGQVADRLGDDHPIAGCIEHPFDDPPGFR